MKASPRSLILFSGVTTQLALILALLHGVWPYSYYMYLRFFLSLNMAFLAWMVYRQTRGTWGESLAVLAVIFNPLVPVHFTRPIWNTIDSVALILLSACIYAVCFRKPPAPARPRPGL